LKCFTKGIQEENFLPLSNSVQEVLQKWHSKTENRTILYHCCHGDQN